MKKVKKRSLICVKNINKYGHRVLLDDLKADKYTSMIPKLSDKTTGTVIDSIQEKLSKGLRIEKDQVYFYIRGHIMMIFYWEFYHISASIFRMKAISFISLC